MLQSKPPSTATLTQMVSSAKVLLATKTTAQIIYQSTKEKSISIMASMLMEYLKQFGDIPTIKVAILLHLLILLEKNRQQNLLLTMNK